MMKKSLSEALDDLIKGGVGSGRKGHTTTRSKLLAAVRAKKKGKEEKPDFAIGKLVSFKW